MGVEHGLDTVVKAQELYCNERLSFAKVAELTKVTATTLKAWAKKYNWKELREELAKIELEIKNNTIRSRQKALEMLLQSGDGKECSQMAFAVSSLENLAIKQQELVYTGKIPNVTEPDKTLKINNKAEAINAMSEAVENKLAYALANPENINSQTIQDVKKMLDIIDELKKSLPSEESKKTSAGLSTELAESLRKALNLEG